MSHSPHHHHALNDKAAATLASNEQQHMVGRLKHSESTRLVWSAAGKSTIAQQLASRINVPNIMQTDVIYEVGILKPG
jgi:2-phosphoglycerate kinase